MDRNKKSSIRMRLTSYCILIILFAFSGCKPYKNNLYKSGGISEALENGITIFENESRIFKKPKQKWIPNIYTVDFEKIYSTNFGECYELKFMPFNEPWYKFPWTVEGCNALYSDFIFRGGRVYVWNNPNKKVTEELLDVHRKYNAIDENWFEEEYGDIVKHFPKEKWPTLGLWAPYTIDESIPCEEIIISKSDLSQYKHRYIPGWEVSPLKKIWIRIKHLFRK